MKASEPPLKITAFPDLKHKLETSEVTFGLLSKIIPITPIGIEIFLIISPFGLLHLCRVTSIGSLSFEIFFIADCIPLSFTEFNNNLSIKFSFNFFLIAKLISLLFSFVINFFSFSIKKTNLSKTLFFVLLSIIFLKAS